MPKADADILKAERSMGRSDVGLIPSWDRTPVNFDEVVLTDIEVRIARELLDFARRRSLLLDRERRYLLFEAMGGRLTKDRYRNLRSIAATWRLNLPPEVALLVSLKGWVRDG
jgi:hypothetical protein